MILLGVLAWLILPWACVLVMIQVKRCRPHDDAHKPKELDLSKWFCKDIRDHRCRWDMRNRYDAPLHKFPDEEIRNFDVLCR